MISTSDAWNFNLKDTSGQAWKLNDHLGKVLLICNTASKCGFTSHYGGLQSLHDEFFDDGLRVLAFPCNQFGQQEPLNNLEIENFCELNYGVTFTINEKVEVNGVDENPVFSWLKEQATGILGQKSIKWNFTKFLVSRDGKTVRRFAPMTNPLKLKGEIEKMLK